MKKERNQSKISSPPLLSTLQSLSPDNRFSTYFDNVSTGVNRGVEDDSTGHLTRGIQNQEMTLLHMGIEQAEK